MRAAEHPAAEHPAAEQPAAATGFWGEVTGTVKSVREDGTSFTLLISKAEAGEHNTAKKPAAMVGKVISLGTRMPRDKNQKPSPHVDDIAYIKSLKVGDVITVKMFSVMSAPDVHRIQAPGKAATTQPSEK